MVYRGGGRGVMVGWPVPPVSCVTRPYAAKLVSLDSVSLSVFLSKREEGREKREERPCW